MSAAHQIQTPPLRLPDPIRSQSAARVCIGHALVDSCSFEEARSAILRHALAAGAPAYIITPNAQHIVLLNDDSRLREIYRDADLVVPDGVSLLLASRIFGSTLPERVTGVDLFQALCASAASAGLNVFFLGGLPGSADHAAAQLQERHPGLKVETYCPPWGFEHNPGELDRIAAVIRNAHARILFVGLGAPKQDYWIYDHGRQLGVNVLMGIGGSFEMVGGFIKRAPALVRRLGLEWLYRFCKEPRRTWRRYLFGNVQFIVTILKQRLRPAQFLPGSVGRPETLDATASRSR
jgi:N-acetylglucosaminyldiphosphoundecaprenol N-acetyl-beta-D-mannosaminyltransferase